MHVLLIEDDPYIGGGASEALRLKGYSVDWLADGEEAAAALVQGTFDVVVLDLALPRRSGWQLLEELRGAGNTVPVLILTAFDDPEDRVRGLDLGADDYLTKPFDLEELAARLRALHRRALGRADAVLRYGELALDPARQSVTLSGEPVELSRREFALLQLLAEEPGRVVPAERILDRLYGWSEGVESNAIAVHVHNLRRKLGAKLIETVRGVGYRVPERLT